MSDLHLDYPQALHFVWVVLGIVVFLIWRDRQGAGRLDAFMSKVMRGRLVVRPDGARRLGGIVLFGLAGLCLVGAMVRPQWGLVHVEATHVGAEIMVCLDVSKSMLAEDVAPNRLRRAKAEIGDLITLMDTDHVGLIAFAGRASVLCPMTPDDGFLRMVLDSAGPHSVARGGTNLEAPVRKAMASFRGKEDSARVILLITDGEDHDSFVMDAAKEAREQGVKIIAIGLGDENGSRIEITNPQTGAREAMRDSEGAVVISKLDGRTLRELALATEGVYVPAGTGVLDLLDIHEKYIKPLMRSPLDTKGLTLRHEAYQYPLLGALLLTLLGAGVMHSAPKRKKKVMGGLVGGLGGGVSKVAVVGLMLMIGGEVDGQPMREGLAPQSGVDDGVLDLSIDDAQMTVTPESERQEGAGAGAGGGVTSVVADEDVEPRVLYNDGLIAFESGALDEAERLFSAARLGAGSDGQLRYQATYNLAWVDVRRADGQLGEAPEEALESLRSAADWFANGARLRPNILEVRENLEIVLLRIMRLADALNQAEEGDLRARLGVLITNQRKAIGTVGAMTRLAAEMEGQTESLREEFATLAADQLAVITEAQGLVNSAHEERDALEAIKEEERTPEQAVRMAELGGVLHYLGAGTQKMTQGRSQLRRRQAGRAFLRGVGSLEQLKRAADQLADPTEVLSGLIGDGQHLGEQTRVLSQSEVAVQLDTGRGPREAPAWLTGEYLRELEDQLGQRTRELHVRLDAGLKQMREQALAAEGTGVTVPMAPSGGGHGGGPGGGGDGVDPKEQARFMEALEGAVPLIEGAGSDFEKALAVFAGAGGDVGGGVGGALGYQAAGLEKLKAAREFFLDMRALIELVYGEEAKLEGDLEGVEGVELAMGMPALRGAQGKNLERAARLKVMLADALAEVAEGAGGPGGQVAPTPPMAPAPSGGAAGGEDEAAAAERERLTLANKLLDEASVDMEMAGAALKSWEEAGGGGVAGGGGDAMLGRANQNVAGAVEKLQALRRLFFSIVEHLRETLGRQIQLNDETAGLTGERDGLVVAKGVGPLVGRQAELAELAGAIGEALREQAAQNPADAVGGAPGGGGAPGVGGGGGMTAEQQQASQEMAERFAKAAEKVDEGRVLMEGAGVKMEGAANPEAPVPPALTVAVDLEPLREDQDGAAARLAEALEILEPPQENEDNQEGDDQQQQQEQQEQQEQGAEQQQQQAQGGEGEESSERDVDTSGLLQSIRDREQQRERERQRRPAGGYQAVEKDW